MNAKNILKKVGIGLVIIIVVVFAVMGSIIFDVASYTATGSESLTPNGNVVGNALVVYDPGLSGAATNTANTIARQLQDKGYQVDVVGIKNSKAMNTSSYDIVVVGGPVYAGKVAISVQEYLKSLNISTKTKLGVFFTGQDPDTANNYTLLLKEAAPLPDNSNTTVTAAVKIVNGNMDKITAFVNNMIQ